MHTPVIAFVAEKGGVGKTTLSANVAAWLAHPVPARPEGLRVLAIDTDPQANLTQTLVGDFDPDEPDTQYHLGALVEGLAAGRSLDGLGPYDFEFATRTTVENLFVLPGDEPLAERRDLLGAAGEAADHWLGEIVQWAAPAFDVVIIDTPPTLGPMYLGALACADFAVVPLMAESAYSIPTYENFARRMDAAGEHAPTYGLVAVSVKARSKHFPRLTSYIGGESAWFGQVPESVYVARAPLGGVPAVLGRKSGSPAALGMRQLAEDAYAEALSIAMSQE